MASASCAGQHPGVESLLVPVHTSPYDLPVYDLMHRPGEMRERTLEFDVPEHLGDGVAVVRALDIYDAAFTAVEGR